MFYTAALHVEMARGQAATGGQEEFREIRSELAYCLAE
jgi:hypothetical protein